VKEQFPVEKNVPRMPHGIFSPIGITPVVIRGAIAPRKAKGKCETSQHGLKEQSVLDNFIGDNGAFFFVHEIS